MTYVPNMWNTYVLTSIMHETLWKCKCDAMHEHMGSFKQKPTQTFHKNFINFEKPQKLSKTPKVRSEWMKCVIYERKEIILEGKNKD